MATPPWNSTGRLYRWLSATWMPPVASAGPPARGMSTPPISSPLPEMSVKVLPCTTSSCEPSPSCSPAAPRWTNASPRNWMPGVVGEAQVARLLGPVTVGAGAAGNELAQALGGVAVGSGDRVVGLDLGESLGRARREPRRVGELDAGEHDVVHRRGRGASALDQGLEYRRLNVGGAQVLAGPGDVVDRPGRGVQVPLAGLGQLLIGVLRIDRGSRRCPGSAARPAPPSGRSRRCAAPGRWSCSSTAGPW